VDKFKLPSSFSESVHSRLEETRAKYNESLQTGQNPYEPNCIPSVTQLECLIETAFWASLRREEDRALKFHLTFEAPPLEYVLALAIDPIPFDTHHLVKLAPASADCRIGVAVSTQSQELEIVELSRYIGSPVQIKVLDPGQLIVSFWATNIAFIDGDETALIKDALLSRNLLIWRIFRSADSVSLFSARDIRVQTVLDIARRMREIAHGGTLIIVPKREDLTRSVKSISYSASEQNEVPNAYLRFYRESERDLKVDSESQERADELKIWKRAIKDDVSNFIAQLTAVDGATLITSEFDVIAFGVKLKSATESNPSHAIKIDPLDHEQWMRLVSFDNDLGGTRHTSAARFVYDYRSALAIVVSQDRDVTAYVWNEGKEPEGDGTVCAFERLELTLF
jgi:hypothetical protein